MNPNFRYYFPILALLLLFLANEAGATSYTLTTVAQGSGIITRNPTNTTYPQNVTVTLTAVASNGWYFSGWSGDATGTNNPLNVTMTGDLTVTGLFLAYPTYTLSLTTNGQGAIDLNPAGGDYDSNTVVTATETAAAGWLFTGWSGATNSTSGAVSLAVDSNLGLSATFVQLAAFDVQPQSVTNEAGSTVSFSAHSVGAAPVSYQWYFTGNPLPGDTSATLTLSDVTSGQAGAYQVIATNLYGSTTSVVASLVLTNASQSTNVVTVCDEASLRAAISAGGWISIGCSGTITLSGIINITNQVVLDGSGVTATISGGNSVPLFNVAPGASLSITNLTLANGSSPVAGGAIYDNGGTVTLSECILTNNRAYAMVIGTVEGGAIYNNGGTIQLYNSALLNNSAFGGSGGGYEGSSSSGSAFGGGIFNTNGSVTVVSTLMQSNLCGTGGSGAVVFGGALFQASGSLFLTNDMLVNNEASSGMSEPDSMATPAYGGALAAAGGTVSMNLCQCLGNIAAGGDGDGDSTAASAFGGAVYCSTTLTAIDCSFNGNSALAGGDSYDYGGPSTAPPAFGGGICNLGRMVIKNCEVSSNYSFGGSPVPYANSVDNGGSGLGGGIYNAGMIAATNCTIALNTAEGSQGQFGQFHEYGIVYCGTALGGGICNSTNGNFVGVNVTIASNVCNSLGSGIVAFPPDGAFTNANGLALGAQIANTNGTVSLLNSLIAYGGTNGNAYGVLIDLGDNISSDGTAGFASGSSYNFTDPLLGALANNGGPTLTMALQPDSPAIGFANSGDGAPPDDQRGYARPTGIGVIDLGAYQYGATPIYPPPPSISLTIAKAFPNVVVSFTTAPAITNTLHFQVSTNLINWVDLQTIGAFASPSNISETISSQGVACQYFRLSW